jgi:energy-coupling factor transport system ATP-binding protein
MSKNETLIQVSDLHYAYEDGTVALRGVDLEIGAEEFIAFIGQNGSGKTTLSKCLNGLFRPTSGTVMVGDLDTSRKGIVKQLVTEVGYVFQNPDHQLFNSSVWDEIAYGPQNIGLSEEEVDERVREAAAVAGVSEESFEEHPFFMHKGLRQRVAIASILALRPRTIIVDEPTTGQDRKQSVEIMDFLMKLRDEEGHTIIIITHEMPIVAEYAERAVALRGGRVLLDGPTKEVFSQPDVLAETFVHPPQITQLGQLLADVDVPPDVLTVPEMQELFRRRLGG